MKIKGFTLAELLGVIVILGIVTVITVPVVTNSIDKYEEKLCRIQYDNIINAAKAYKSDNLLTIGDNEDVLISKLVADGYIKYSENTYIKNPIDEDNNFVSNMYVRITKNNKKYSYNLYNNSNELISKNYMCDLD